MKLLDLLKNINRLLGGEDIGSTTSVEEAAHFMVTLGGFSSVNVEDDDLSSSQKAVAFNDILKYNTKRIEISILAPASLPNDPLSEDIRVMFDTFVNATTTVTPVVTARTLMMSAKDLSNENVWEIPNFIGGSASALTPGSYVSGSMVRSYTNPHVSSIEGNYSTAVQSIKLHADLLVDTTDLVEDVEYNFFMLYRLNFDADTYDNRHVGRITIAEGLTKADFESGDSYNLDVTIIDAAKVSRFDLPTTDGFEGVTFEVFFIITDSEGWLEPSVG